ncbi:MAG: bifunctional 3-(3-hydroxy-phenyl)propionate/3-hydroxycinnamic acid hydroxylase [Actinomycetota bacterium]
MALTTDVVVIGCGPVGAAMAIALRAQGLDVTIVEKEADIYHLPRAIGLDEELFRAMQNHGLAAAIDEITTPLPGAEFVDVDGNRIVGFDLPDGTVGRLGHPPMTMYYQPNLDTLLRRTAVERGAELRLPIEVVDLVDTGDGVRVSLADGEVIEARWAVACDGASSPTRKRLGITPIDQGFDQEWIVIDVEWHGADGVLPRNATQICDPARPGTFVPGDKAHRRWEFQALPGETRDELESPAKVWELLARWMTPDDGELIRAVSYRFHAVVADRMRKGSVFLAGDSAHQMPPFLGQGLDSGFRDVFNLAWKLGMVSRGVAGDALLDTYDEERRPHAATVVEYAVDAGRLIDALSGKGGDVDESAGYGGGREFPDLAGSCVVGAGTFVGTQSTQVRRPDGTFTDDRLGSRFAVLVADATLAVPEVWRTLGRVVEVESAEIGGHGCSIVRPDRYVAAVADTQDELDERTAQLVAALAISV